MKSKHWLMFILLGVIWGSSFLWIKIAVQEVGPIMLVAFRSLFGLLFCLVVVFVQRVQWPRSFRAWLPLLVLGLTNIAVPFFLISWGEQHIDSAVASVLDATVPLFTILIAHFLLQDDKITLPKLMGLLVGFAGVVVLMMKDLFTASASSLLGQAAVLLASMFYAVSSVIARKTTEDTPGILRSAIPLLAASVVMWPSAWIVESPLEVPQLGITWFALLWLGILGSGLAFLLAFSLIHEMGPTRMTMVTYLFPVVGVILGTIFLHEQLTWQLVTGTLLVLISLVIANWTPQKKSRQLKESRIKQANAGNCEGLPGD